MHSRWMKIGICLVAVIAVAGFAVLSFYFIRDFLQGVGLVARTNRVAIYEEMEFTGPDAFYSMTTKGYYFGEPSKIPDIYVQLKDRPPILLTEFSEELAAKIMSDRYDVWDNNPNDTLYSEFQDTLIFRNGKLISASFAYPSAFRVGSAQTEPFLRFPIDQDELVAVFGQPLRWERREVGWRP